MNALQVIYYFKVGFIKDCLIRDIYAIQELESLCLHLAQSQEILKVELYRLSVSDNPSPRHALDTILVHSRELVQTYE